MSTNKTNKPQSPLRLWLFRKRKWLVGIAVSLTALFSLGFFFTFWRQPIPSDIVLPKGTRVIVSRSPFVFFLEGNTYYLRAWCPGSAQSVATNLSFLLSHRPYNTNDSDYAGLKRKPLKLWKRPSNTLYTLSSDVLEGGFVIPTHIGPPNPTNEGYELQYKDNPTSSCHTSYNIWPDRQNTQIEVTESCSIP